MDARTEIDWGKFAHYSPNEIECRCGAIYRSHSKSVIESGKFVTYTQRPCPGCELDRDNAVRISSEPELYVVRPGDVGRV